MAILIRPAKRVRKVKTRNGKEVLRRLEEFLKSDSVTGEPVEFLCGFWKDQQNAVSYQELRQAVMDGSISQETMRLWMQDYSVLVKERLSKVWTAAIAAGPAGQPILDGLDFEFNMQSSGISNWISMHGAEFVTNCTKQQKDAIAALLDKKMKDSHTVDELSRLIRPCIGLTESDTKAAARFYDNIVANLKKDHPRMKPESIRRKALDATHKYAERKHRARAMTIAQTESAFAYNWGADEGIRQAQAQNLIGTTKKHWNTSGDDRVCPICAALEGVEVDMDADFNIPGRVLFAGQHKLPPAHPRCACAADYIETAPPLSTGQSPPADDAGTSVEETEVSYIGTIDNATEDMVKSTLEEYEKQIAESSVENAVIITKDGLIWKCTGSKDFIALGSETGIALDGAYVTHNHPVGSPNEYSFSRYDISFFMGNGLKILRGVDERYVYELTRDPSMSDKHAVLEELMASDGSLARHEYVIDTAKKLGIGYRRWRR